MKSIRQGLVNALVAMSGAVIAPKLAVETWLLALLILAALIVLAVGYYRFER